MMPAKKKESLLLGYDFCLPEGTSTSLDDTPKNNYGLDSSVQIPSSVKPSLLKGNTLEALQRLPADKQCEALKNYDAVVRSLTSKGEQVRNPRYLFHQSVVTVQKTSQLKDKKPIQILRKIAGSDSPTESSTGTGPEFQGTVVLPSTSLKLAGKALVLFNSLPPEQQPRALIWCDEAAVNMSRKGKTIENPDGFFHCSIQSYLKSLKTQCDTATESTASDSNSNNQSPPQKKTRGPSGEKKTKKRNRSRNGADKTASPSKNSGSPKKNSAAPSDTTTELAEAQQLLARVQKELEEAEERLETRTEQCSALAKMYENEKQETNKVKEQYEEVCKEVKELKVKLSSKDDLIATCQEEKNQSEQKNEETQAVLRDMTVSFTKLSNELCNERQEKKDIVQSLEEERCKIQEKDSEIQKLKAELKRADMLRPSTKASETTKRVAALRRELQETQQKLVKERSKNAGAKKVERPKTNEAVAREKPSLSDFVDAAGKSVLASKDSNESEMNAFDSTVPAACSAAQGERAESGDASIHFDGVDKAYDLKDDDAKERVKVELSFLAAAYGEDELKVEANRVIRSLQLIFDRNSEIVNVDLILTVEEGYPISAPLAVEASISPEENSSVEARKVAMDALPALVEVCRYEAKGCVGDEAMLSVLQTADQWLENEWAGIQAKRLPAKQSDNANEASGALEICRLLVSTHHLVDSEKIQLVKSTASKYDLGGYVKTGYPGYLLVEGFEDNCEYFLETLVQQRVKNSRVGGKADTATFSKAGKTTLKVSDVDSG